ncbi:hypothetical protein DN604_23310 [Aeromonas caviae]|nr:hypothetical protein DN604_23310 [Aeromonas caviae]
MWFSHIHVVRKLALLHHGKVFVEWFLHRDEMHAKMKTSQFLSIQLVLRRHVQMTYVVHFHEVNY